MKQKYFNMTMRSKGSRGSRGRRGLRVANVIRQVVSQEMILHLSDPRVQFVTVTEVELADDLRFADVRISVLGDEKKQAECLRAIKHAQGHIQEKVAEALVMKFCPLLRFHLDQSIKRSVSMGALIAKARAEDEANRADRVRRGIEPAPLEEEPLEETPPVVENELDDEDDDEDEDDELEEDESDDDESDDDESEDDESGDDESRNDEFDDDDEPEDDRSR
jgi:ribosome-binding factor A